MDARSSRNDGALCRRRLHVPSPFSQGLGSPTKRGRALELPRVELLDALALCLLFRDRDRDRYERSTVRLHGRLCLELSGLRLADAQLACARSRACAPPELGAAVTALAGFCENAWGSAA